VIERRPLHHCLWIFFTLSGSANGGSHPRVALVLEPCVNAPAAEVRRLLAIDLPNLLVDGNGEPGETTLATITCDGTLTLLRVDDPLTKKALTRFIDLRAALPAARARLLALATSELIFASWTELVTNPEPAVPAAGPPVSPEAREEVAALVEERPQRSFSLPRLRVLALAGGQSFFNRLGFWFGGGLRVG
jgi:hypothetical protein